MLKEIKLPLNTSLVELLTVSFFIAVGYSILYKFNFYSELGIEWYIYSLTPNFILLSSIKLLSGLLLGAIIAIIVSKEIISLYKLLFGLLFFSIFIWFSLKSFDYYSNYLWIEKRSFAIFSIGFLLTVLAKCMLILLTRIGFYNDIISKSLKTIILIVAVLYMFSITAFMGKKDAESIKENIEKLNIAVLKNNKISWRLMEFNGDKAMLINKLDENNYNYKIIEVKEIESIKVHQ